MSTEIEQILRGTSASPGVAIGRAYLVDRRRLKVPKRAIEDGEIDDEIDRFQRALRKSHQQLETIKERISGTAHDHYNIITAHQLILQDEHLVDATIRHIRTDRCNSEWALRKTVEEIKSVFDAIEDDYFRERRSDVDFVGDRVMRVLMGRELAVTPPPDAIVVAHDLSPADTAQFYKAAVAGLATDAGGRTSHSAIVARAHGIPAVVGLESVTKHANMDDLIIVDGSEGQVILNPTAETVSRYRELARQEAIHGAELLSTRDLPSVSLDGRAVTLNANIDHTSELKSALEHGAMGVGLFRTEFMFMTASEIPSEDELFAHACDVHEHLDGLVATFRTIDFGADKVAPMLPELHAEANPALGLRSIRLCLTKTIRPLFKAQLRALLRASTFGPTRIMFPMISGLTELELAREVLDEAKDELRQGGVAFDESVPVGIMIEMPSAAMIADHLASKVDFFSIGTNDLIQYTLAVDRGNEYVAYLYEPLHPALLRLIDGVVKAAKARGIPVGVCGEMAGEPTVAPVLLGIGVNALSMHATAIPEIKKIVRTNRIVDFERLAARALTLPSGVEIAALVQRWFRTGTV